MIYAISPLVISSPVPPVPIPHLAARPPAVSTLAGRPVPPGELASSVVLFWRADCGPCLSELSDLAALKAAASPMLVRPAVLEEAPGRVGPVAQMLARAGLQPSDTLRADGDAAAVLTTYGGAPPRLPLAIAFDGEGHVCGRRTGLLGYDHLRAWAVTCGSRNAARR